MNKNEITSLSLQQLKTYVKETIDSDSFCQEYFIEIVANENINSGIDEYIAKMYYDQIHNRVFMPLSRFLRRYVQTKINSGEYV